MITCVLEGGDQAALRHTTVDAILIDGEQVVLTRRGDGIPEARRWALPGGYVDRDETVVEAVRREVLEEIHIIATSTALFAVMSDPGRDAMQRQNVSLVFLVENWEGVPEGGPEVSEIRLFSRSDLPGPGDMAADHHEILERYFRWVEEPGPLPLVM